MGITVSAAGGRIIPVSVKTRRLPKNEHLNLNDALSFERFRIG